MKSFRPVPHGGVRSTDSTLGASRPSPCSGSSWLWLRCATPLAALLFCGAMLAGDSPCLPLPGSRFVVVEHFDSAPLAAAALARGGSSIVSTGDVLSPYVRFSVVHTDFIGELPPDVRVHWKEFDGVNAREAADMYRTQSAAYAKSGMASSSEATIIIWWVE